jgi:2-polyprenyl-6-methoxyphenol hydroxylase-like FAD-dependent oxidoreductase
MAGAATLAAELATGDHRSALGRYETEHRRLVDPRQRSISAAAALIVPASRPGIVVRNLATRLSPLITAARSVRR